MDVDPVLEDAEKSETIESGLRDQLLDYIASLENVYIKSQQIGEPELSTAEKRSILEEILNRNVCTFLSRFGQYLLPKHVPIFENHPNSQSYEVQFYLSKLKNNQYTPPTKVQIKNRRFEAMKRLMSEGEYFSVSEMRKRNPLLFDQLLGNFMKNPERKINEAEHSIANVLLEQIEQDQVAALKQAQIEAEMKEAEEYAVSDEDLESYTGFSSDRRSKSNNKTVELWGKSYQSTHVIGRSRWKNKQLSNSLVQKGEDNLTQEEKVLLISEFTSAMFNSFLQGKDEFDYNDVDNNPEYDDIYQYDIDAEEKYFDSESPENAIPEPEKREDDELDKFMKDIDYEVKTENLAESLRKLDSSGS